MLKQEMLVWYHNEPPNRLAFDLQVIRGIVNPPTVEVEGTSILINDKYVINKDGVEAISVTYTRYARPRTMAEADQIKSAIYLIDGNSARRVTDVRELFYRGDILASLHDQGRRLRHKKLYRS